MDLKKIYFICNLDLYNRKIMDSRSIFQINFGDSLILLVFSRGIRSCMSLISTLSLCYGLGLASWVWRKGGGALGWVSDWFPPPVSVLLIPNSTWQFDIFVSDLLWCCDCDSLRFVLLFYAHIIWFTVVCADQFDSHLFSLHISSI